MRTNQVAIVTGAGRGIGRAIATRCAQEGMQVALVARTETELQAVADEISSIGGEACVIPADISDGDAVETMMKQVVEVFGWPDLLVNNAYTWKALGPLWEVDKADWWDDISVDLFGVFLCCHAVLPSMVERRKGYIINLIGAGMDRPLPYGTSYAVAKTGVMRLTECLAAELTGTGVSAFAVDPGLVKTPGLESLLANEAVSRWLPGSREMVNSEIGFPPTLAADLIVRLASGGFESASGRAFFVEDDVNEVAKNLDRLYEDDLYSLRMKRLHGTELNPILDLRSSPS